MGKRRYEDDSDDDFEDDREDSRASKSKSSPMIARVSGAGLYSVGVILIFIFWILMGLLNPRGESMIDYMGNLNMRQNGVIVGCSMLICGAILFSSQRGKSSD